MGPSATYYPMPRVLQTLLLLIAAGALAPLQAASPNVDVRLVAEDSSLAPGEFGWLALEMKMAPHWHTYWRNPGSFGKVTEIIWQDLPQGVTIGGFRWPSPMLYKQEGDIFNYVYEGQVALLFPVTLSSDFAGDTLTLKGKAKWLECDDSECVPGSDDVSLTIEVKPGTPAPGPDASIFKAARESWPKDLSANWNAEAYDLGKEWLILLKPLKDTNPDPEGIYFYSRQPVVAPEAPQVWTKQDNGSYTLKLTKPEYAQGTAEELPGVMYAENGWLSDADGLTGDEPKYMAIVPDVTEAPPAQVVLDSGGSADAAETDFAGQSFFQLLGLAFLGGLILNLMPCVFPVLGLKIMNFVNQGGQSRGHIALHGLVYIAGVLLSFWVLAIVLIVLRTGGQQLGWGFQLQAPGFVLGMAVLLLVFGLSLSGVFEIGLSAVGIGNKLTARTGLTGSFFSGVLSTLVATPCAAPLLAPALGAALAVPPLQSFLLFTVIGLGLSFPYALFSLFPKLVSCLPKPGPWMETLKIWLSFLLYGTVAYLLYILAGQVEGDRLLDILLALVGVALACWVFGHYGAFANKKRKWGISAAVLILAGSLFLGYYHPKSELTWEKWSPEKVAQLQDEGRTIYVDFTARWCATCQVNKRVVFGSEEVVKTMLKDDVALLKADWTSEDPTITAALESFGRSAVPFNVIYSPKLEKPIQLPEVLTPGMVLDALKEAKTGS